MEAQLSPRHVQIIFALGKDRTQSANRLRALGCRPPRRRSSWIDLRSMAWSSAAMLPKTGAWCS